MGDRMDDAVWAGKFVIGLIVMLVAVAYCGLSVSRIQNSTHQVVAVGSIGMTLLWLLVYVIRRSR